MSFRAPHLDVYDCLAELLLSTFSIGFVVGQAMDYGHTWGYRLACVCIFLDFVCTLGLVLCVLERIVNGLLEAAKDVARPKAWWWYTSIIRFLDTYSQGLVYTAFICQKAGCLCVCYMFSSMDLTTLYFALK